MQTVGLIGAGYWGSNYLRVFHELPSTELKWCADLDEYRLADVEESYPGINVTTDYNRLLRDPELDAICIATPPNTHFEIAAEALAAGLHVLVEKPLTIDAASAWELADRAAESDHVLLVGHIFEYHEAVRRMRSEIQDGRLGDLYYLEALRTGLGPIRSDVSALWDLAVHDISIFRYLLDSSISSVKCIGQSFLQSVPDSVFLFLEFEDGIYGHTHCSWLHPQKTRKVTVVGADSMAVFNDTAPDQLLQIYESTVESHQPTGLDEFHYTAQSGDLWLPKIDVKEPLKMQIQHFIDCIVSDQVPLTGGAEGARVVEVLEAAERSMEQDGDWVSV